MFEKNVKYAVYALYAVVGLLFVSAILSFAANKVFHVVEPGSHMDKDRLVIATTDGRQIPYTVEVAVTPEQMDRGLMYRESMARNAGMLFIYNRVEEHSMWMKNTQIPLDMVFIDTNNVVSRIRENARPYDLTAISSITPARAVLELNAGQVPEMGIKVGDHIESDALSNLQLYNDRQEDPPPPPPVDD